MPLLESLILTLGPAIGNTLLKSWLGESVVTNFSDNIVDLLTGMGADKARQRALHKQLEAITQQVADELRPLFDSEARGLGKDDRAVVVHELAATLEQARLDTSLLIGCGFEAERLAEHLRALQPDATRDLSAAQTSLYERLLHETSRAIVRLAPQLDGFTSGVAIATLQDVELVREIVRAILKQPEQAAQQFERDYREAVAAQLDKMDYFGIPQVDALARRQPLSAAYVTLQFERRAGRRPRPYADRPDGRLQLAVVSDDEDAQAQRVTQSGSIELLLAQSQHVVIAGEAGGGKSTLLRWLAVRAARQDFPPQLAAWNQCVPFFIRLRERVGQPFPTPHELPALAAPELDGEVPQGWTRQQLKTGRALVLVDGVDELPREQRGAMLERLDQLVRQYPLARYIISSRPSALKADEWPEWAAWVEQVEFDDASLQALDPAQIEHLIDKWHAALARTAQDATERAELAALPDRLKRQLRQRPALRRLATNPLLCAMLCALHRERGASLPAERIKLYDECVEMLLERRDSRRGIALDPAYPQMSFDQKLALLKSFALWLMRNGASDVECAEADELFEQELPSLGLETTGERVRAFFVERGALLREPIEGRIDFAHRTFQEYLAAQAALEEKGIGELLSHARDDQWRETIILAAGKAYPKDCDKLLRGLIEQDHTVQQETDRHRLQLLAIACLETAVKVPQETRQYVLDQAAALFPPKDVDEARLVAAAGEPAVPLLKHTPEYDGMQAAACVRALALIGSDAALETTQGYANHPGWRVQEEIGRAWDDFDRAEYARRVLGATTAIRLLFIPSAEHLQLVPHLTTLSIEWLREPTDLAPLAQLPALASLRLSNCPQLTDLTPLAQLPALTQLALSNCPQLTDLTPLAQLPSLAQLDLIGCRQLSDLAPLAQLPALTQLTLAGCPQLTDLAPLAQLPALAQLILIECPRLSDLAPLANLTNLRGLNIQGTDVRDVSPLAHLPNLKIRR